MEGRREIPGVGDWHFAQSPTEIAIHSVDARSAAHPASLGRRDVADIRPAIRSSRDCHPHAARVHRRRADGRDPRPRRIEDPLRVTIALRPPPSKPLPIIVKPVVDELLSSWLRRTAHLYMASTADVLAHFSIVWPDPLRQADFAQSAQIKARLAWGLRTTAARIQRAGHPVP